MKPLENMIGYRSGRLVVVSLVRAKDRRVCRCLCDCGGETLARPCDLVSARRGSCGCLHKEVGPRMARAFWATHRKSETPEFAVWVGMRRRCTNPKERLFARYGARGISVCERWSTSFMAFLEDMGPRPSSKHSIDRIDVNGNYEPGNCRWATTREQALNKRTIVWLLVKGERMCMKDAASALGINRVTFGNRVRAGRLPPGVEMEAVSNPGIGTKGKKR